MPKKTYKECLEAKCKDCNYDPDSAGTFREQTAACENGGCPNHERRPVPRSCWKDGDFDRVAIAAVREKLDRINRERASR
jgi:hypothetical protein